MGVSKKKISRTTLAHYNIYIFIIYIFFLLGCVPADSVRSDKENRSACSAILLINTEPPQKGPHYKSMGSVGHHAHMRFTIELKFLLETETPIQMWTETWTHVQRFLQPGSKASLVIWYVGPIWSNSGHTLGRYWRRFRCIVCTSYRFLNNCDAMQCKSPLVVLIVRADRMIHRNPMRILCKKRTKSCVRSSQGNRIGWWSSKCMASIRDCQFLIRSWCNSRFPNKHCFIGWACRYTSKNKHYRYQGTGVRPF